MVAATPAHQKLYLDRLRVLRKRFVPNTAQQRLLDAVYKKGAKRIILCFGRKTGKTEGFGQVMLEFTATLPGRAGYVIGPTRKQENEIIWENGRIIGLIPPEVKAIPTEKDNRISFPFGPQTIDSYIKIDGSEEHASYRGTEYDIMALDEYQACDARFYDAAYPNLASRDGLLILAGTIDSNPQNHFNLKILEAQKDPEWAVLFARTWENAHNLANGKGEEWLKREKEKYYERGDGPQWEREYEARFVFGGKRAVFPTYLKDVRRKPLDLVQTEIERDRRNMLWLELFDPSQSCFGVLFVGINPYTKQIYSMREIYETDRSQTSAAAIWKRVKEIEKELKWSESERPIMRIYDEAAAWFENEMATQFKVGMVPSEKQSKSKEDNISLVKTILTNRLLTVADECVQFDAEMTGYEYDDENRIIKLNDHLIDGFFYGISVSGYVLEVEAKNVDSMAADKRPLSVEESLNPPISNECILIEETGW